MTQTALEQHYTDATARARRKVAGRYFLNTCPLFSPDYPSSGGLWREVWEVELQQSDTPLRVLLAIPFTFPDDFPVVYLPTDVAQATGYIPHLSRNRLLCTFDASTAIPNADYPEDIVFAVLERARTEYYAGVEGRNSDDFADETEAYWRDTNAGGVAPALSLVVPSPTHRRIYVLRLDKPWRSFGWLFTETQAEAKHWLKAVGYKEKTTGRAAFYVSLADMGLPPFPDTNSDMYLRLKEHSPDEMAKVMSFLKSALRPTWVLAALPASNGRSLVAWQHPAFTRMQIGRGGRHQVACTIPGFRSTHQPAEMEMTTLNGGGKIRRTTVTQIQPERLLSRTSGARYRDALERVTVIGCGSVGSLLANEIARAGQVRRMGLIDNQVITPENTLRHLCGMSDVGKLKVQAVSNRIQSHFPHVHCKIYREDVLDLLRTNSKLLQTASLKVIALGNTAVERRLNRLIFADKGAATLPACFVWVEPHLYGGHLLYLGKNTTGCFECLFDEQFKFCHRVVAFPQHYTGREAGCHSTYVPYGGADLTQFVASCVRFLHSTEAIHENILLTWVGDLEHARLSGVTISEEYTMASSFSTISRPVFAKPNCLVCS